MNSINLSPASNVVVSLFIIITIIAPIVDMTELGSEVQDSNDLRSNELGEYIGLYIEASEHLPDDAIVLTGKDITFGLYASTESYRYIEPSNPINHAIEMFDATHIYTDSKFYRYDIDVNYTYLYGSPIEPQKSFHSEYNTGFVWTVNESKMENISLWSEVPLIINGAGTSYGNFALLEANATLSSHPSADIYRIIELNNSQELSSIFDVLSTSVEDNRIICSSITSCEQFNREDNMGSIWAIWVV